MVKNLNPIPDPPPDAPLFNLSPRGNFKLAFLLFVFGCMIVGFLVDGIVNLNNNEFRQILTTIKPVDIKRIEVQRMDFNGNWIDNPIIINDTKRIINFVYSANAIQDEPFTNRERENEIKVKLWLANGQQLEFGCYTNEGNRNTIFVHDLWIKPSIYGFGNGQSKFPPAEFYNWLTDIGITF